MALEVIQAIRESEKKAEDILKKAHADAKETQRAADRQNEEIFERETIKARQEGERILSSFEEQAEEEKKKRKEEMQAIIGRAKTDAIKNMDAAVDYILGRLE